MNHCLAVLPLVILAAPLARAADPAPPVGGDAGWVTLIGDEGPVGIARVGRNLSVCGAVKLGDDRRELVTEPGEGVVAAVRKFSYGGANNLVSKQKFGDCEVSVEFLIGNDSNSGVKLQERYEIQLFDSAGKEKPAGDDCGGVYPHWSDAGGFHYVDEGVPPSVNSAKPAGEWQTLHIVFRAPRFDADGKKTENARFVSVTLNDQQIHKDVQLESPTGTIRNPLPEVAEAPLYLQMDHGAIAFRNVRVKPIAEQAAQ